MPTFLVPSMTITISATRSASSIYVTGLIVCNAPVNGNPQGPARMNFFVRGAYVGNTYGGPVESQPYHRQYTFSFPAAGHELATSVLIALYDASTNFVLSFELPIGSGAPLLPTVVPGKILRSLFWTSIDELIANPSIVTAFHAAGVNTLHTGIFSSPVYNGATTFAEWEASSIYHASVGLLPRINWARANGFYLIGTGDDLCRNQAERDWTNNTSWAGQAIARTREVCHDNDDVVAYVAMRDEQGGLPTDDPVYQKIVDNWRAGPGPGISWPNQRQPGDVWETAAWSDIDDRYAAIGIGGPLAGLQNTVWQCLDSVAWLSNGVPVPPRPFAAIIGGMGTYYQKLVTGDDYHPGQDRLIAGGPTAEGTGRSALAAVAYGASVLRCYAFDAQFNRTNRTNAAVGQACETGLKIGSANWIALSDAYNWIAANEAALCGPYLSPFVTDGIIFGRRENLTWTVEMTG